MLCNFGSGGGAVSVGTELVVWPSPVTSKMTNAAANPQNHYLRNCKLYVNSMADLGVKRSPKNTAQLNWSLCVIMLGDSGTGKTSLVEKFVGRKIEVNKLVTVEKEMERQGHKVHLEIRDTAGMERYRSLTKSHYKGSHGALLVFDVTNEDSFNHIKHWYEDLITYSSPDQEIVSLLVGTGSGRKDVERVVKESSAKSFAENHDMEYVEVGVESRDSVDRCFNLVVDTILSNTEQSRQFHTFAARTPSEESGPKLYLKNCTNCCGYFREDEDGTSSEKDHMELEVSIKL